MSPFRADAIRLPYGQRNLTFEFAVPNSLNPGRIRYRFKLDNLERRWTEVDSAHRLARYTDLGPGDYNFRAEASADGRSWNIAGANIKVTILPPWWRTWWAELLLGVRHCRLAGWAYQLRVGALHKRQRELAALVEQRTAELVEARDQAQAASEQAQAANRAKSVFLANMSHELRTPLNAILGFARILHDASDSDAQRRDLSIVRRSGEHLLHLINDVLEVAKAEVGHRELELAPCDVSGIGQQVIDMISVRAMDKGLGLHYFPSSDLPACVLADAPKLRQVLINLLGNAINYTERGGVTLRITAHAGNDARHSQLVFEVEDTGIGIAPEDQGRIFEAFVQLGTRTTRKGTGLAARGASK